MEHLPPVVSPYQPILVPFIAEEYDGLPFAEYPSRRGLDLGELMKGNFESQGMSSDQVASFLQTWLCFGLLHGVTGINFETKIFVRVDESTGKKWLTTKELPRRLQVIGHFVRKAKEMPEYTEELGRARNDRINTCLRVSRDVWEAFSRLDERFGIPNPMSPAVATGIQILAITLQVGATELCGGPPGQPLYRKVPWEEGRHWRYTQNMFLEDRLISHGWCPTIVKQIWDRQNPLGQYYASLLGPPHRKLDHSKCNREDKECTAMKLLPPGRVMHEVENCQCCILAVDAQKVVEIIRKDQIPVLRLIEENGIPALEVVSSVSEPGLEYTAMSHVWTDGWGNPNENSLPLCRVKKLVRDISATYSMPDFEIEPPQGKHYRATKHDERVYFWMDTLCVPRTPSDIYSRAIMQMRDVYTQAERVLVYDAEIMASTANAGYEELNMRIVCSRWIRRLWTVQEAVLAKRLIFQFAERPHIFMTGSLLWAVRQKDLRINYFNCVGWDCNRTFEAYDYFEGTALLNFVWKALLTNRSVSVESDEAICACILMNLDLKKLMAVPTSDRIKTFWTLLGDGVPLAALLVSGRRLNDKGFSWAPASLLSCAKIGTRVDHLCSITEEGLRAKIGPFLSFEVDAPQSPTNSLFSCILQGYKYFIKRSPVTTNPPWEGLHLHNRSNLAIILEIGPSKGDDGRWSIGGSRAALVSIVSRTDETLYAEYLRLVSVIQEGSTYHKFPNPIWTPQEIEGTAIAPSSAKWIEVEQQWCFV